MSQWKTLQQRPVSQIWPSGQQIGVAPQQAPEQQSPPPVHVAPAFPQQKPFTQVPLMQSLFAQHSWQVPLQQRWPEAQVPVWQIPPQPSLLPHALPAQSGVHTTHVPFWQV